MMKVGLIGCGEISHFHMDIFQRLKNVEVIAVSDILLDRVKSFANRWEVDKYYVDYHELLENEDLDFVDICTPVWTHAAIAIDTAKSGHNVLLEKPMALSSKDCDEMIETAKKHNVSLCVNHHNLFYPSIKKAKSLVESGYFDLQSFQVSFYKNLYKEKLPAWAYKPEYGGLLWEVGTHPTYITHHFLPDIKKVYATGKKSGSVYDGFSVLISSSTGSFGIMKFSFTSNYREEYMCQITSQNGNAAKIFISLDSFLDQSKFISSAPMKFLKEEKDHIASWTKATLRSLYHRSRYYDFMNSKFLLMKNYVESIKNKSPPPVTPEDGKATIRLLECMKESLETEKAVPFK
jgi:UDP-N-acetyl-2-amino-2-deoxyglucuronate dehydrogenase